MQLRNPKDFWSGVMFAAIGFAFAIIVKVYEYPMGTASRMGPGYFPFVLGNALGVLGLVILLKSFLSDGERVSNCLTVVAQRHGVAAQHLAFMGIK